MRLDMLICGFIIGAGAMCNDAVLSCALIGIGGLATIALWNADKRQRRSDG